MKEIVVISGKGGTGKTFLCSSLAPLLDKAVFTDLDVDASNLHLMLSPKTVEEHEFKAGKIAVLDPERCSECMLCRDNCRFDAIKRTEDGVSINEYACEGCAVCARVCPEHAIEMQKALNGHWFISETEYGPFVHARLLPGEENSGKLVSRVREEARKLAREKGCDLILSDGSPGTGCPVIASLSGTDYAVIVAEPSMSGLHDAERILELSSHFGVKTGLVVNKTDINPEISDRCHQAFEDGGADILADIPYTEKIPEAITEARPYTVYRKDEISEKIQSVWQKIRERIAEKG